jgi:hypothetical protein
MRDEGCEVKIAVIFESIPTIAPVIIARGYFL